MVGDDLLVETSPFELGCCGRPRILIVDDDRDQTMALSMAFQRQGYETVTAHTGADAISAVDFHQPQLVILDIHLPDADGLNLCRQFADEESTSEIPVILLSGSDRADIVRSARASGCHFFLRKPYDPNALLLLAETSLAGPRGW